MPRFITLIIGILLMAVWALKAQTIVGCQYWIDNNYHERAYCKTTEEIDISEDCSKLEEGLHYFNLRAMDSTGEWGPYYRYLFYYINSASKTQSWRVAEYWFDEDYSSHQTQSISGESFILDIDINSVSFGLHYLNLRVMDSNGSWNSLDRYLFYVTEKGADDPSFAAVQYWIDNDFSSNVTSSISGDSFILDIDLDNISVGLHNLNLRIMDKSGNWNSLERYIFYAPGKEISNPSMKMVEYWLDEDYSTKSTSSISGETLVLDINLNNLNPGVHYVNMRIMDNQCQWSALDRYLVYIPEAQDLFPDAPIVGYAYSFGAKEEYVSISPTSSFMLVDAAFDIPALKDCYPINDKCSFKFSEQNISLERKVKLPFGLKLKNAKNVWSSLSVQYIDAQEQLSHPIEQLSFTHSVTYKKGGIGDFGAFKMDIEQSGGYFMKTSQKADMFLYNSDGTLYMTLNGEDLLKAKQIPLYQGRYYGVIYNMINNINNEEDSSDKVTIRLLLTESYVPSPIINFDGSNATITCEQEGAQIHFTLDGTDPNTNSAIYNEPIAIDHNCTIKAYATYEDLSPSDIVSYKVNSFKVEKPIISFENLQFYMTCSTPNSKIYYTLDGRDPDKYGVRYLEPIKVSSCCTAKAIAKRDGYNNSEIAIYVIDESSATCPTPTIIFSNGSVTINCLQDGANIYYTTDGTTPTTRSPLYNGTFNVEKNCTIKAIAVCEGLFNSAVAAYKIDNFKVATPVIAFANLHLHITCSTSNASIFYTLNGSDPDTNGILYSSPIDLEHNCTVKAIAKRDGYNNSDIIIYVFDESSVTCPTPSIIFSNGSVTINCLQDGAKIYYTTDGTTPTISSSLYNGTFNVEENCTIKAIAVYEGFFNSTVAEFTIDSFKVATPDISFANLQVHITCSTSNASILYTLNDSDPYTNGILYSSPIDIVQNCTVKAIAKRNNYHNSDVATYIVDTDSYTCPKPTFTLINNTLEIKCLELGCKIRYTIDGSIPSSASAVYTSPITLDHNCVIKAYAEKYGYFNSEVALYTVDWFQAGIPTFNFVDGLLSMTSDTEGAHIHYTIGGEDPDDSSTLYVGPITLTDNKIVKAIAYADNFNPSEVASFRSDIFTCEEAHIAYDGRYVTLSSATEGASIYYTTDGSNPTENSSLYKERFDIGGLCTLRVIVLKEDMNNSSVIKKDIEAYFDGECAQTSAFGILNEGFGWCNPEEIEEIQVIGTLNKDDLTTISQLNSLKHLDLSYATLEDNVLPARAFANTPVISVHLPSTITKVEEGIFEGCNKLAAIKWNAYAPLTSAAMKGFENPNLLLYVAVKSYAPTSIRNVIVDNVAENITLIDGNPGTNYNFYCPEAFTAKKISYTHSYTQRTIPNVCAGWESLTLPFEVSTIKHKDRGEIAPFAALENAQVNETSKQPFWLYSLTKNGFEPSDCIVANTPYIISMPNSDTYADDYILAGEITFSAENILVPVTTDNVSRKGQVTFIPTTLAVEKSPEVYAINRYEVFEGNEEGSMFVSNLRAVEPFEGYWIIEGAGQKAIALSIFDINDLTGLMPQVSPAFSGDDESLRVYTEGHVLYIESTKEQHVNIYSINGTLIKIVDVKVGSNSVEDLIPGFYIVGRQKVVLK